MWDSMLGKGFKAQKCSTLPRLVLTCIKLLRIKRKMQVKQLCKEISELLICGQEPSARIRLFATKYGKSLQQPLQSLLRPDCGLAVRIIEKLSARAPSGEVKLKLMKETAAQHDLGWDPTNTEAELLKSHQALFDEPKHFLGANELPSSQLSSSQSTRASDVAIDVPIISFITMSQMPADLDGTISCTFWEFYLGRLTLTTTQK